MAHLTTPTPLVYTPLNHERVPRRAAVQLEPVDDPHFEVRAPRPGPPGRSWFLRVQACRFQPAWAHFGMPSGHSREALNLDKRVVLAWFVAERAWGFPGVAALVPESGWTGFGEPPHRFTAARAYVDERACRLAYGLARLQVVSLVRRLRTPAVWRGLPDNDYGDMTLHVPTLTWLDEGDMPFTGDLPGNW